MAKKRVVVKQEPENEIPVEIIASSIKHISDSMRKMNASKLNERALVVLLQDLTSLTQRDIKKVLSALSELEQMFLKRRN